jgi:hypothetical protein
MRPPNFKFFGGTGKIFSALICTDRPPKFGTKSPPLEKPHRRVHAAGKHSKTVIGDSQLYVLSQRSTLNTDAYNNVVLLSDGCSPFMTHKLWLA